MAKKFYCIKKKYSIINKDRDRIEFICWEVIYDNQTKERYVRRLDAWTDTVQRAFDNITEAVCINTKSHIEERVDFSRRLEKG